MPGGNEYFFIFYSGLLTDCKPRKVSKQEVMTKGYTMRGYIQIYGGFRMSCKSRGKENEIESVQSHRETSDFIEKGIKYFSRTGTGKRPKIYFKIAACGTESKKNLKVAGRLNRCA